jgi:hypothetical protein
MARGLLVRMMERWPLARIMGRRHLYSYSELFFLSFFEGKTIELQKEAF